LAVEAAREALYLEQERSALAVVAVVGLVPEQAAQVPQR
jgi:hypothetical protein